jgi:hypothetical protein
VGEELIGLDLIDECNDSHEGAGGEEVIEPRAKDGEVGGEDVGGVDVGFKALV